MMQMKACFSAIPDPRRAQARQCALPHLPLFSVLAVASGATSCR